MGRLIKLESAGKQRAQLVRLLAQATQAIAQTTIGEVERLDLLAFIILTLEAIQATIEPSVQAWEKRGYWVKADQFRQEWMWTGRFSAEMREAVSARDWSGALQTVSKIQAKLAPLKLPERQRMQKPWTGAWKRFDNRAV